MVALLVLATVILYWPATRNEFVNFDDVQYVLDNVHVTGGLTWENVKWAFQSGYASNWHPLTWLSHMADCQMFGVEPWGHHLTSVLLHAVNVALLFALLRQLTGATWRSLFAAALFAVHPLHVESVAWVAERKDMLSGFFGFLSLIFYARYAQKRSAVKSRPATLDYVLALFFLALGLMSKPMLVTWPFVMLLLDCWPLRRFSVQGVKKLVLEKIPFFALVVAASVVTFLVQKHGGAVSDAIPPGLRCENALVSYCRYLGKMVWPADMAVFYQFPKHLPMAEVLLAGGLMSGISVVLIVKRWQYPFLLMGWLWFVGTLVPVIGLVPVGGQAMADRYVYIPSVGIFIFTVWGLYELASRWRHHSMTLALAGLAAIILCMVLTRQQIGYWKDSEILFSHDLEVTENNYLAHNNLGDALFAKGQTDDAISQYQKAIRLKPYYAKVHNNLGSALAKNGRIDDAISQYEEAIRLKPDDANAHNNLGIAFTKQGRTDDAISQFQVAIRLNPDNPKMRDNLGFTVAQKSRIDEVISQYEEAIRLKPNDAETRNNLGIALGNNGRIDDAISQFQETIRLKPDYVRAYYNLGVALARKGRIAAAIRQFQEAIRLQPDYTEARNNLARMLEMKNASLGR